MRTAEGMRFGEVARRSRLSERRLDYLVAERYVRCERRAPAASGVPRLFRPVDLDVAAVLGRLAESGSPGPRWWGPVAEVLYSMTYPWPRSWIVLRAGCPPLVFVDDPPAVANLGAAALVICLPPVLEP